MLALAAARALDARASSLAKLDGVLDAEARCVVGAVFDAEACCVVGGGGELDVCGNMRSELRPKMSSRMCSVSSAGCQPRPQYAQYRCG